MVGIEELVWLGAGIILGGLYPSIQLRRSVNSHVETLEHFATMLGHYKVMMEELEDRLSDEEMDRVTERGAEEAHEQRVAQGVDDANINRSFLKSLLFGRFR